MASKSAGKGSRIMRSVVRRIARPIPIIGTAVVLAGAAAVIRRKGLMRGGADIALDLMPIVGTTKGLIELVTGDLIPDVGEIAAEEKAKKAETKHRKAA